MSTAADDGRPVWEVAAPPGGWGPPWPQVVEIVRLIPHTQWTLIGGIMVQLHAVHAGMQITRPTRDVDMVLHIETGVVSFSGVREKLEQLGYVLREPMGEGPVHRFVRGDRAEEQVDVMVADHLPPSLEQKALRRKVFEVPGGTSALRKTVNCHVVVGSETIVLSIPDALGALVLKGAAYLEDARDRRRHLDDAVVLTCTVSNPMADRERMIGSDSKRIRALWSVLQDRGHPSWIAVGERSALRGHNALRILVGTK
ncbi:hypothetical protein ACNQVK_01050 [Mycobacterium sp. 134]|uniref:hypothetical protein n=1 Tax=Mycobacterium sp. 134 TaxID=3400425 RepID=UPI003AAAA782